MLTRHVEAHHTTGERFNISSLSAAVDISLPSLAGTEKFNFGLYTRQSLFLHRAIEFFIIGAAVSLWSALFIPFPATSTNFSPPLASRRSPHPKHYITDTCRRRSCGDTTITTMALTMVAIPTTTTMKTLTIPIEDHGDADHTDVNDYDSAERCRQTTAITGHRHLAADFDSAVLSLPRTPHFCRRTYRTVYSGQMKA